MADEKIEFVKNYEHCFFAVIPKKQTQPRAAWLKGLAADGSLTFAHVTPSYKEGRMSLTFAEVISKTTPIVPASGYFNVMVTLPDEQPWNAAMYVSVSPDRQYRKGLAADHRCTSIPAASSPYFMGKYLEVSKAAGGESTLDNRILAEHLAKGLGRNFVSARQAVDMAESGDHLSVAFSRHFCVTLRPNFKTPVLMFNGQLAGVYNDGAFYVLDKHLHFKDFFQKKWGIDLLDISSHKGL